MESVDAACLGEHASVIDQNVDAAEMFDAAVDTGLGTFDGAHIGEALHHFGAEVAAGDSGFGEADGVAVGQQQARAFCRIGTGDGGTDAATGAGDHGAAISQLGHVNNLPKKTQFQCGSEQVRSHTFDPVQSVRPAYGQAAINHDALPGQVTRCITGQELHQ